MAMVAAAMTAAVASTNAAAAIKPNPKNLTLRLIDLDRGFVNGTPSRECAYGLDRSAASRKLIALDKAHRNRHCTLYFEDYEHAANYDSGPVQVASGAIVFATETGARRALSFGRGIVCTQTAFCGPGLRRVPSPEQIGDQTVLYDGDYTTYDDAAVAWRSGRVLSFVTVGNLLDEGGVALALRFAERQQERVVNPTPLRPRDNDDRDLALDAPDLGLDVHWLGRSFKPKGLPRRNLSYASTPSQSSPCCPEPAARIEYGARVRDSIHLEIWRPADWKRAAASAFGERLWNDRSAKRVRLRLSGRRVVIVSRPAGCPPPLASRSPRFEGGRAHGAIVRYPDTVVTIRIADGSPPCSPRNLGPYDSLRGVRAIARGLRLRAIAVRQPASVL